MSLLKHHLDVWRRLTGCKRLGLALDQVVRQLLRKPPDDPVRTEMQIHDNHVASYQLAVDLHAIVYVRSRRVNPLLA